MGIEIFEFFVGVGMSGFTLNTISFRYKSEKWVGLIGLEKTSRGVDKGELGSGRREFDAVRSDGKCRFDCEILRNEITLAVSSESSDSE